MELLIRETVRRVLIMKALLQSQFYEVKKMGILFPKWPGVTSIGQDKVD